MSYLEMVLDVTKETKVTKEAPLEIGEVITKETKETKKAPFKGLDILLTDACLGLDNVTGSDLFEALAPDDLSELAAMGNPRPFLKGFALALSATRWRKEGVCPPWWDKKGHCAKCGPVWLWDSIDVAGCPWCWNRLHGLKTPHPTPEEL